MSYFFFSHLEVDGIVFLTVKAEHFLLANIPVLYDLLIKHTRWTNNFDEFKEKLDFEALSWSI